jgi:hypothetical protein
MVGWMVSGCMDGWVVSGLLGRWEGGWIGALCWVADEEISKNIYHSGD